MAHCGILAPLKFGDYMQKPTYDELVALVRYLADKCDFIVTDLPISQRNKDVIAECYKLYYNRESE